MEVSDLLRNALTPDKAVVIYRGPGDPMRGQAEEFYLEMHSIIAQGDRYTLGPGTPLTRRQTAKLASLAVGRQAGLLSGFLPKARVLYLDPAPVSPRIVWWRPPEVRGLIFDEKQSGIPSGKYPLPALVFDLCDRQLSVYAAAEAAVAPDTLLMKAPLPNIYNDGSVCLGNCKKSEARGDIEVLVASYEDIFYRSQFTHFNHEQVSKVPVIALFKKIAGSATFPVEELVHLHDRKITLRDIVNYRRQA